MAVVSNMTYLKYFDTQDHGWRTEWNFPIHLTQVYEYCVRTVDDNSVD